MSSKKSSDTKKKSQDLDENEETSEGTNTSLLIAQKILNDLCVNIEKIGSDSCSQMSKYFRKSNKSKKNILSIMAYAAKSKPKQPFMNAVPPSADQGPPNPGTEYPQGPSQTVTNQPRQREFLSWLPLPPPPSYFLRQQEKQSGEVKLSTLPPSGPGQMAFPPTSYFNLAYWAPYPDDIPPGVPPCLAHLVNADSLFIVQQVDLIELYMNIQEPNFYLILNTSGQCIYYAYETSDLFGQICCKGNKGLQLHIKDMYHNEIIYMNKPCGCADCFCCFPIMEVYSPPLIPVGAILRRTSISKTEFIVVDADENKMFKINGPLCLSVCNCVWDADFTINALDQKKTEVGVIRRENGGFVRTGFTNADYYGITFPKDLDVRVKAVFLGALFLISVKRTGWLIRNVENPETVSGHMYRMSVMTFLIPDSSGVDKTKCLKMSIVHDLAECVVGDLTPFCGVDPNEKHKLEDAAMKELTQMIGESGLEIYKLYKEYEAQVTNESKFVKDLDRLDMVLQAYEYEKIENKPGKLEEFFTSSFNKLQFPWTMEMVNEIRRQRDLFLKKELNLEQFQS